MGCVLFRRAALFKLLSDQNARVGCSRAPEVGRRNIITKIGCTSIVACVILVV